MKLGSGFMIGKMVPHFRIWFHPLQENRLPDSEMVSRNTTWRVNFLQIGYE
jgi:hypothetical protein